LPCRLGLYGYKLAAGNGILLISSGNCGDADAVPAVGTSNPAFFAAELVHRGGSKVTVDYGVFTDLLGDHYKLCWAAVADSTTPVEDYNVEIDYEFDIIGPELTPLACTLGVQCDIDVSGFGVGTANALVVISSGSCGGNDMVVANNTWTVAPALSLSGMTASFTFGTPVEGLPGNFYKLCWAANPRSACPLDAAIDGDMDAIDACLPLFNIELDGDAELAGPDVMSQAPCTMGLDCIINVTGYNIGPGSSVIVIPSNESCGDPNVVMSHSSLGTSWAGAQEYPATQFYYYYPIFGDMYQTPADNKTYTIGKIVRGQPGEQYKLCWAHDARGTEGHKVELQTLFGLAGPYRADYVCYLGLLCQFVVSGWGLETDNQVVVVYGAENTGCGDSMALGYNSPYGVQPASLNNPGVLNGDATNTSYDIGRAFGGIGDHFKLCWAAEPTDNIPAGFPDFNVEVDGTFNIQLPSDDDDVWSQSSSVPFGSKGYKPPHYDEQSDLWLVFEPSS
jgi:hypothetical protein